MLKYPGQDENAKIAQEQLRDKFEFAERLFSFWMYGEKDKHLAHCKIAARPIDVAMYLNVQACRQFRTVVELCKIREGFNASAIARSLYETTLAVLFVLKPDVRLKPVPKEDNTGTPIPGKFRAAFPSKNLARASIPRLRREFRATLYLANAIFQDDKFAKRHEKTPGRKRVSRVVAANVDPALVAKAEKELGVEWTYIVRHNGYCGLPVAQLARVLGNHLDLWYDTIYDYQSRMIHAVDAFRHAAEVAESGQFASAYQSTIAETDSALYSGIAMFLVFVSILQEEINFGWMNGLELKKLREEYKQLFRIQGR